MSEAESAAEREADERAAAAAAELASLRDETSRLEALLTAERACVLDLT